MATRDILSLLSLILITLLLYLLVALQARPVGAAIRPNPTFCTATPETIMEGVVRTCGGLTRPQVTPIVLHQVRP